MNPQQQQGEEEFVTIIGANMAEVMQAFRSQGLAERQYSIVHRGGQHQFTLAHGEDATELFDGAPRVAATFSRRIAR